MHRQIERQLSAYLDRELSPGDDDRIRRHLEGCDACREEMARLARLKSIMAALPERPVPRDFWPQVRRGLHREAPRSSAGTWLRALRQRPAPALAAAVVVLLFLLLPLVRGQIDRLRAAEFGLDLFVREHALAAASDPLVDRAYVGLLVADSHLALVGERRPEEAR